MTNTTQNIGGFLAEHAPIIFNAFQESGESPKGTWEKLQTDLPKIGEACGYDTFRKCLSVLIAMHQKHQRLEKENQILQEKISKLRGKGEARNIGGWTVRKHKNGYYMLQKSFKGKVQTIYIGKELDEDEARRKIAEKTTKLRQAGVID